MGGCIDTVLMCVRDDPISSLDFSLTGGVPFKMLFSKVYSEKCREKKTKHYQFLKIVVSKNYSEFLTSVKRRKSKISQIIFNSKRYYMIFLKDIVFQENQGHCNIKCHYAGLNL